MVDALNQARRGNATTTHEEKSTIYTSASSHTLSGQDFPERHPDQPLPRFEYRLSNPKLSVMPITNPFVALRDAAVRDVGFDGISVHK